MNKYTKKVDKKQGVKFLDILKKMNLRSADKTTLASAYMDDIYYMLVEYGIVTPKEQV